MKSLVHENESSVKREDSANREQSKESILNPYQQGKFWNFICKKNLHSFRLRLSEYVISQKSVYTYLY